MGPNTSQVPNAEARLFSYHFKRVSSWFQLYWFRISVLCFLSFIFLRKDFTIELNLNSSTAFAEQSETGEQLPASFWQNLPAASSFLPVLEKPEKIEQPLHKIGESSDSKLDKNQSRLELFGLFDDNTSNTYSNMTYTKKKEKKYSARKAEKIKKQKAYVKRFAAVAQSEMKKFGIPASITLAQGLIESNAGESRLATQNNNHFGMKCFSKKCGKGHCSNFTDDSHKDFFRKYPSAWASYRAHSKMLMGKRYKGLKKHGSNYNAWAHGLKKAGYATDKNYATKLIHIIEELELDRFDQ